MEIHGLRHWLPLLEQAVAKPYFPEMMRKVDAEYDDMTIFPPKDELFSAFEKTPPEAVRAVILGQDPYHELHQANGLAFSVYDGVPYPPSLRNIFTELKSDVGVERISGDLSDWAEQGVFLLNTVLSVRQGNANSHKDYGWQIFTDDVIAALAGLPQPIVFVLWGAQAQKKKKIIEASPYPRCVICAPHPSPLSCYRGFYGSKPFSQVNRFLEEHGEKPIIWG